MPKADTLSSDHLIFSTSHLLFFSTSDFRIPTSHFQIVALNPFNHIGHGRVEWCRNTLLAGVLDDLDA